MGETAGPITVGLTIGNDFSGGELTMESVSGIYGGTLQMVFCVRFESLLSFTLPSTLTMTSSAGRRVVTDESVRSDALQIGDVSESRSL